MEALLIIFVAALVVEAAWEALKHPFGALIDWLDENTPVYWDKVGSMLLGVLVCVLAGIDLLALLDVTLVYPVVGAILTGAIVGRGSNFVHDLIEKVRDA